MTFVKWLKQYEKSDTPIGDLARDMIQEKRDRLWAKKRGEEYRPYGYRQAIKHGAIVIAGYFDTLKNYTLARRQ